MAPRRGGRNDSVCAGAFSGTPSQVYFAEDVLFFTAFLSIGVALCVFRKRGGAGKRLLGIPYILAVLTTVVGYAISIIGTIVRQCTPINSFTGGWEIAALVFYYLGYWLFLVVFVWTLNTMLRQQLGHISAVYKVSLIGLLGFVGALTCALIGLTSYLLWTQTEAGYQNRRSALHLYYPQLRLRVVYYVVYMLSVLAAGGLALKTTFSLRSRKHPAGDLLGWVVALAISMFLLFILGVVFPVINLQGLYTNFVTNAILTYFLNFFQVLSFIFIVCIAKHASWSNSLGANEPKVYGQIAEQQQPQYAYNPSPNSQVYYGKQAPIYDNTPELAAK